MAFDGMFVAPEDDPRQDGGAVGELATYRDYLRNYRLTLELKCQDLSPQQLASRSVPPSTLSLLGLVRHAAYVEQTWFQRALQGNLDEPRPFTSSEDHDVEFNGAIGTPECVEEAFAAWRHEVERADAWLDARTDGDMGRTVVYNSDGAEASVRDILVHLIEEYARHCGHADLLRECVDGRTGE
ncbi:DinB family protein [Nocardioides sp. Iso805N]|uniref:DinB family protein n=1 Tax=Nocardioides sp. Iso805N TaxID=1283287 RepID=UPI000381A019|nr:DinB family protein [Nocardioides sp. Iso805N]